MPSGGSSITKPPIPFRFYTQLPDAYFSRSLWGVGGGSVAKGNSYVSRLSPVFILSLTTTNTFITPYIANHAEMVSTAGKLGLGIGQKAKLPLALISDASLPCGPCSRSHAHASKLNPLLTATEPECTYVSPEASKFGCRLTWIC